MRNLLFGRIALFAALAGFLLPWLAVSLGGAEIAAMSGIDSVLGRAAAPLSQTLQLGLQPALLLAALAVCAALAVSYLVKSEKLRAALSVGLPALAIAATFLGVLALKEIPRREIAASANSGYENILQAALSKSLRMEERPGYFLTLLGLAAAAGIAAAGGRAPSNGAPAADTNTAKK